MSGLNTTLCYFLALVALCVAARVPRRWQWWHFVAEFLASFTIAASRLEVQTISEIGQWAGGLGPDVAFTMLLLTLAIHRAILQETTGNPSVALMRLLQNDATLRSVALTVGGQLLAAHLALLLAKHYWAMELTDMHMIKNLMASECSTSLRSSPLQGTVMEAMSALVFHMVDLALQRRTQLLKVPILTLTLTFLAYAANAYTSGYVNPALAYSLTFSCPGHTFLEYAQVYWLGPLLGMALSVFLYRGHIPLLFSKNLLYSDKSRFRVPKSKNSDNRKTK